MYRPLGKTTVGALLLALVPRGLARQPEQPQHHPGDTLATPGQGATTAEAADDEDDAQAPMRQHMQGMLRHMRGMRSMLGPGQGRSRVCPDAA